MKSKNFKSILKRTVSFVTASAMMLGISAVFPELELEVSAAGDVTVTLSEEHQTIVGFGGINHPEWAGDLTEAQRATAFGNGDNQLGFTVLRVFVNPDKNQWNKALPTAQYASKAGATVFASPWEPPANLAESGGNNGKLHIPKSNYAAYAQHLNDFGSYMKNNGVDLYSISVQNEPDYAHEWTYWSTDETTDFLANYADKITSTKVMSPESFQYSPDGASWILGGDGGKRYYKKILNNAKAFANCDVFGTHFYGTTREWMDFPELEQCGKQIWMTEVYVPDSKIDADKWPDSLELATNMHNGLVIGNMSAYVIWYIRRSYGALKENGQISKRGYMMAQFSKYIRPGYVRVGATEQPEKDVYVSAYKGGGDKVVIVAVNSTSTEYNKNFTVKGASIKDVDRYRSSGSENLVATLDMKYDGDTFNAQLPAQSVSTFVVTVADGSGIPDSGDDPFQEEKPAEPDANGYYFHDTFEGSTNGWAAHGGSTVETSGRNPYKGEEALLVQERQKAWNGAEKSLSTVTFEPGKEYSFSADVVYLDSDSSSQNIFMKLQYTDSSGETSFSSIAEATAVKGQYVQLANTNYKIPEGASNLKLYIETEEGTDNFYVDEAIGAVAGTKIEGPAAVVLSEKGDITGDGSINVLDVVALKKGLLGGFASTAASIAADVDESGKADIADLLIMKKYVLGMIDEFPKAGSTQPTTPDTPSDPPVSDNFQYDANLQYREAPGNYLSAGGKAGTVVNETYTGVNGENKLNVYLPNGYDSSKKYNIFYLMHGGGENENTIFSNDVKFNYMLDHMIEDGVIEPMIVVTPTFNKCSAETVYTEMKESIVPFVEGKYSTYAENTTPAGLEASRMHRAFGGFSMGGGATWNVLINDIDYFGYYMPLSGHCWGGANAVADAVANSKYKNSTYILAATGTEDIAYGNFKPLIDELKKKTDVFTYTSDFSKGNLYFLEAPSLTHWWGYVRHYVYDGLPYFFHNS